MGKKTIQLIILFSSLSLAGIIITQTLWVRNALDLSESQHSHRVDLALDDVLEELADRTDSLISNKSLITASESEIQENLFQILDTVFLAHLLSKYVEYHNLDENYHYAIVRTTDDSIIYESTPGETFGDDATIHRACLYCLWKKDYFHLEVHFPSQREHTLIQMSAWLFSSAVFLLIFILSFYYTITTVIRQKKISQIRDDLLNNITHEFKTPISTISLASEVMIKNDNSEDGRISRYAKIIFDENKRMRTQVDRVLQMAALDRGEYSIEKTDTNLDTLLINVVNNLCLEHCETIVNVKYNLIAENPVVNVDSIHLSNIVSNLVNNAIKYSNGKPVITISSKNENNSYIFSVEDQGIGIRKENFKQIFEKFYRVPTGNVHNVRGFGIGLYYVKTMIELHKGKIHVYSEPGKGTRFDISLPQEN